jgi:hypothetical protein
MGGAAIHDSNNLVAIQKFSTVRILKKVVRTGLTHVRSRRRIVLVVYLSQKGQLWRNFIHWKVFGSWISLV